MAHALIVEDDQNSAEMLAALVSAEGFSTATAGSLHDAIRQYAFRRPDIVLLDLSLPDGSGIELFDRVERNEACEVVLITGHATLETSIQALRLGAADYLLKPVNVPRLRQILARASGGSEARGRLASERAHADAEGRFGRLWGKSAAMREIHHQIARVAPTAVTAFITGESGTGKEVVAQTIHDLSKRAKAPFLAINCGSISPQLIESELFGHEKGSFTGALRQHRGFFERADGGTLFLDEITEMPMELQVKLLRVLETGSFVRVGSDTVINVDVRIIAATNRPPAEAVSSGKLREDLYYRLNVFPIELPPLRDRLEDVPLLAERFLIGLNEREGADKRFSESALRALAEYRWPGNVRELRNAVHRGFILAEGDVIDVESLPIGASGSAPAAPAAARTGPGEAQQQSGREAAAVPASDAGSTSSAAMPVSAPAVAARAPAPATTTHASAANGRPALDIVVGTSIAEAERRLIVATVEHCGGHRERAAAMLGISAKTLYNRLKGYAEER
ncbi:MAG: sigma-54 dependent transcriptional regulator [Burkholderiaceae bacterium]|nr:sigma-54 dependent transcriptional regulator [Burkholderiaceae bacterium]